MKWRKILAITLAVLLSLGLFTACGETKENDTKEVSIEEVKEASETAEKSEAASETAQAEETKAPEETKAAEEAAAPEETEAPEEVKAPDGEVTAESLLNGYFDSAKDIKALAFVMSMDVAMHLAMAGEDMNVTMTMDVDFQTDGENSYMVGSMKSDSYGEKEESSVDQYVMLEDGEYVTYSYDKDSDSWSRYSSNAPGVSQELIPTVDPSGFKLEEDGNQYKVSGSVDIMKMVEDSGETYNTLFGDFLGSTGGTIVGDANVEYRFNKETQALESVNIDMAQALEDTFRSLLEALFSMSDEDDDSSADLDVSVDDLVVEVPSFTLNLSNISTDDSIKIVLPEAAKGAVETENKEEEDLLGGGGDEDELSIELADSFDFKDEYKNFSYEGHEYNLDTITIGDFLKDNKGLALDEESAGKLIPADETEYTAIYINDDYDYITFLVRNDSKEEKPIEECSLFGIEFSIDDPDIDFKVAGIGRDATLDDIIEAIGSPTYGYEGDYFRTYSWESDDWETLAFGFSGEGDPVSSATITIY